MLLCIISIHKYISWSQDRILLYKLDITIGNDIFQMEWWKWWSVKTFAKVFAICNLRPVYWIVCENCVSVGISSKPLWGHMRFQVIFLLSISVQLNHHINTSVISMSLTLPLPQSILSYWAHPGPLSAEAVWQVFAANIEPDLAPLGILICVVSHRIIYPNSQPQSSDG